MRSEYVQRQIDDAIAEGWRIDSESPERVVLVNRNFGDLGVHILLALLTAWWSFGLVNLVYGSYKYLNDSQRMVLRDTRACPECGATNSAEASYCHDCGASLPTVRAAGSVSCPECGIDVSAGDSYCPNCGTELAAAAERESAATE